MICSPLCMPLSDIARCRSEYIERLMASTPRLDCSLLASPHDFKRKAALCCACRTCAINIYGIDFAPLASSEVPQQLIHRIIGSLLRIAAKLPMRNIIARINPQPKTIPKKALT
jgi:hypothetical protein